MTTKKKRKKLKLTIASFFLNLSRKKQATAANEYTKRIATEK